jgi:hypothetical protein
VIEVVYLRLLPDLSALSPGNSKPRLECGGEGMNNRVTWGWGWDSTLRRTREDRTYMYSSRKLCSWVEIRSEVGTEIMVVDLITRHPLIISAPSFISFVRAPRSSYCVHPLLLLPPFLFHLSIECASTLCDGDTANNPRLVAKRGQEQIQRTYGVKKRFWSRHSLFRINLQHTLDKVFCYQVSPPSMPR